MRLFGLITSALVALLFILFAISNGVPVAVRIEPLPFFIELPLYGAVFVSLLLGFLAGGLVAWLGGARWRRRARRAEAEVERLRRERAAAPPSPGTTPESIAANAGGQLPRAG